MSKKEQRTTPAAAHTPTPWKISKTTQTSAMKFHAITGPNDRFVGDFYTSYNDDNALNASFIVTACNNHAQLVEALRGLMWRFESDDSDPHATEETAPDILAARKALEAVNRDR